jgi:hypothetical protein
MISGFVVDSGDRAIQGAKVTIEEIPEMKPVETTSDGRFIINDVPQKHGEWVRIRVVKEGYRPNPYTEDFRIGTRLPPMKLKREK